MLELLATHSGELVLTGTQVISVRNIITVQDVFLFHLE